MNVPVIWVQVLKEILVDGCIPLDETTVYKHNLDLDIVVCGRWMSRETLGACMFTRDETMLRIRYLGSNIAEDFGR